MLKKFAFIFLKSQEHKINYQTSALKLVGVFPRQKITIWTSSNFHDPTLIVRSDDEPTIAPID